MRFVLSRFKMQYKSEVIVLLSKIKGKRDDTGHATRNEGQLNGVSRGRGIHWLIRSLGAITAKTPGGIDQKTETMNTLSMYNTA